MANRNISQLLPISEISTGDILAIYDIDADLNLETKKISVQQFDARYAGFDPTADPFGEMYVQDNTSETVISVVNTYYKFTSFITGLVQGVTFNSSTLVPALAATYKVSASISAVVGENREIEFSVFVNGVENAKLHAKRLFERDKGGSVPITGFVELVIGDIVDLRVRNLDDAENVLISSVNLNIAGI